VNPREVVRAAYEQHVLVPAFNIPYLPLMEAVADAVEELNIYAMAEVALPGIKRFEAKSFAAVAERYFALPETKRAHLSLHQDHVPVIDEEGQRVDWRALIREGLDLGYQSVMLDGSRLPLEENITVTAEAAAMAHERGVPLEAELGAVLGHEDGPLPPYDELFESGRGFTSPDEARRFVAETDVDWLSVAIGNIHGAITGAAKDRPKVRARLNIAHLQRLAEATRVPLVLHGGSGISDEDLRQAIRHGIAKINVGTQIRQVYEQTLAAGGDVSRAQAAVRESIRSLVTEGYRMRDTAATLRLE